MRKVNIPASQNYDVYIEKGLLSRVGEIAKELVNPRSAVVISDSNVAPLYKEALLMSLEAVGIAADIFVIEAGEDSKNPENLIKAANFLIEKDLTRSDLVVALGGGVITDLAGLCASLYQRGVALIQIPTSLLAMVDSSVGGKTAVNLENGKNMFGTFYQPKAVICDPEVLSTLPKEEFSNGIAEIIKYALLRGGKSLEILCGESLSEHLPELIEECVSIKRDYVCADEFDRGDRQFLNLGHTVGHAIERASGFEVPHGSAVAAGMCIVARACAELGICNKAVADEVEHLCKKYGLPTDSNISIKELNDAATHDKKRQGEKLSLILIKDFGNCFIHLTEKEYLSEILEKGMVSVL